MHTSIQVQAASPYPQYNNTKQQLELRAKTSSNQSTNIPLSASKKYEGSSELIHLRYHMGPVLSSPINLFLIWYGHWSPSRQAPIRDFLLSISDSGTGSHPTVSQWWGSTAALYADQTGSNVTRRIALAREISFPATPRGTSLTRLTVQQIIADAVTAGSLPIDHRHGVYLVLTSGEIQMQDFCRAVCGFHYFTFPSIVGHTLPYAWVGDSGKQCPEVCAYPFAIPSYMAGATAAMAPPNGDVGVDGMVSVIGHEMAELSTNPLVNAWYAGEDPTAPTEIGDLCEGVYGSGGGGGYTGEVEKDEKGRRWNMKGRNGRRFLVQWLWNPVIKACYGPNAVDQ
ncbi:Protein EXORDIUM-like protein [Dioscorea alata]|uniref:Protein EXORDIUM-like protein n=1 Tax=Dioscorea alata TaxID=55571 RepID=A0ACB7WNY2_DIOAL|nr:Protein EXORDIUM-like protein [Dioscorea alata]